MKVESENKIIFFDGVCGLCNYFVNFILRADKQKLFKFATLQGDLCKKLLAEKDYQNIDSVIYYEAGESYRDSEAIIRIIKHLPWQWRILTLIELLPQNIRGRGYKFIAKKRFKIFKKKDTCRMPTPDEKTRFYN